MPKVRYHFRGEVFYSFYMFAVAYFEVTGIYPTKPKTGESDFYYDDV